MRVVRVRVVTVRVVNETRVYATEVCDTGRNEIKLSNTLVFYIEGF